MRRWFTAVVVLLGMAGTGLAAAAPAASAASTTCLVVDTNANHSYTSLQDAVDAAAQGDTLFVKGTCTGTTTISKNLTISGQSASGTKTATLNGGDGSVLTINNSGVNVTLIITNGGVLLGGGILNDGGTVTLNGSTVSNNTTSGGGGGILSRGTVTMSGTSTVHDNNAIQGEGGGICNSSGYRNHAISGGCVRVPLRSKGVIWRASRRRFQRVPACPGDAGATVASGHL